MINAASTMAAARMERSVPEQQFIILRPKESSWGHGRSLDKVKIIREFVGYTPAMNRRKDAESMTAFLDSVIVNGVQDPGLIPFEEFLPRSAPLVDFLSICLHSGAGWKEKGHKAETKRSCRRRACTKEDVPPEVRWQESSHQVQQLLSL